MKRIIAIAIAIAIVFTTGTCAIAETTEVRESGIYGITGTAISEIKKADGTNCTKSAGAFDGKDFYAEAVRFTVTGEDLTPGVQYKIYVLNEKSAPTTESIFYINQAKAVDETVLFSVYPKTMATGDYYVYIVGPGKPFTANQPLATFQYYDYIAITGVTLSATEIKLKAGKSQKLTATVLPNNATNSGLTWTSSNPDVASIDANGTITAVKEGEAVITVSANDDSIKATCAVTVTNGGGCYVATCVYGSYDCPEVWTLRRFRDETLAQTWYGRAFIHTYYAISPTIVKWFGDTDWFKNMWRGTLDKMVQNLNAKGVANTPYDDINW